MSANPVFDSVSTSSNNTWNDILLDSELNSLEVEEVSNPEIQVLLKIRTELIAEVERLKDMIARLEGHIESLNVQIASGSFTTADTPIPSSQVAPPGPSTETGEPQSITIMNKAGDLELGMIEIVEQTMRIIPAEHAIYDITRGAFARFFLERILGKFQQEDRHRVEDGEIEWEDAFDFEVKAEDNILDEMAIRNIGDDARQKEIQDALRWALEKTYSAR